MKNQILLPIILSALLFFVSAGNVYAFGNGGFGGPFSNDQSFGGDSPSDSRLPSDISLERITGFGTMHPAAAPPTNPGGGGIDVGGPGGSDDDDDNRVDAPVGGGLLILLCIAVMHTFIVMLRRKKEKLLF